MYRNNTLKAKKVKWFSQSLFLCSLFVLSASACNSQNEEKQVQTEQKSSVQNLIKTSIPVEGMSCMSCVANVKNTLSDLNGVTNVKVSLENKKTILQYNPNKISIDSIRKAIDKIGYKAGKPQKLKE